MRAKSSMIDIHTHQPQLEAKYILAYSVGIDPHPKDGVLFSAGIHPWSVGSVDIPAGLEYLAVAPAVAIGETGLDYTKDIDREEQRKVFEAQLEIAVKRNLPVIVHCVKAYNDVLEILAGYKLRAVIFHGYTGSVEQTATIIKRGYYISLNQVSLGSPKTLDSVRNTPLERIFVETDSSNADIQTIYAKLAVILRITTQQLVDIIWNNYKTVFE